MSDLLSLESWNRHYEKAAMQTLLDAAKAITYGEHDVALELLQKVQYQLDGIQLDSIYPDPQ